MKKIMCYSYKSLSFEMVPRKLPPSQKFLYGQSLIKHLLTKVVKLYSNLSVKVGSTILLFIIHENFCMHAFVQKPLNSNYINKGKHVCLHGHLFFKS